LYTPIAYIKTTYQNLIWDDFEQFYVLKFFSQQLEIYAFQTYPNLSYFFESWAKYKEFKFVPLVRLDNTPLMSQPHFEASVRRRLTLPKVGIGSPPRLSQL
jgi:hypothetical protein